MIDLVYDGARMYSECPTGGGYVQIYGSPMRMLRNAIYNHRIQLEHSKKDILDRPKCLMASPCIALPAWIEAIRLKTDHEMIIAGIECQHCIGSYVWSQDIFVRDGNICAQISGTTYEVGQCYDVKDAITKASENLRVRLIKDLKPIVQSLREKQP